MLYIVLLSSMFDCVCFAVPFQLSFSGRADWTDCVFCQLCAGFGGAFEQACQSTSERGRRRCSRPQRRFLGLNRSENLKTWAKEKNPWRRVASLLGVGLASRPGAMR